MSKILSSYYTMESLPEANFVISSMRAPFFIEWIEIGESSWTHRTDTSVVATFPEEPMKVDTWYEIVPENTDIQVNKGNNIYTMDMRVGITVVYSVNGTTQSTQLYTDLSSSSQTYAPMTGTDYYIVVDFDHQYFNLANNMITVNCGPVRIMQSSTIPA